MAARSWTPELMSLGLLEIRVRKTGLKFGMVQNPGNTPKDALRTLDYSRVALPPSKIYPTAPKSDTLPMA